MWHSHKNPAHTAWAAACRIIRPSTRPCCKPWSPPATSECQLILAVTHLRRFCFFFFFFIKGKCLVFPRRKNSVSQSLRMSWGSREMPQWDSPWARDLQQDSVRFTPIDFNVMCKCFIIIPFLQLDSGLLTSGDLTFLSGLEMEPLATKFQRRILGK